MNLLLDQGIPRSTARLLRQAGIDAVHTGEIGYATAEDYEILTRALKEGRVVITLDSDFHMLLAFSGANLPSVVRVRIEGLKAKAFAELLLKLINEWQEQLKAGSVLTVQRGRVRFRRLPLIPKPSKSISSDATESDG